VTCQARPRIRLLIKKIPVPEGDRSVLEQRGKMPDDVKARMASAGRLVGASIYPAVQNIIPVSRGDLLASLTDIFSLRR
jgi:hypothetical protein